MAGRTKGVMPWDLEAHKSSYKTMIMQMFICSIVLGVWLSSWIMFFVAFPAMIYISSFEKAGRYLAVMLAIFSGISSWYAGPLLGLFEGNINIVVAALVFTFMLANNLIFYDYIKEGKV